MDRTRVARVGECSHEPADRDPQPLLPCAWRSLTVYFDHPGVSFSFESKSDLCPAKSESGEGPLAPAGIGLSLSTLWCLSTSVVIDPPITVSTKCRRDLSPCKHAFLFSFSPSGSPSSHYSSSSSLGVFCVTTDWGESED